MKVVCMNQTLDSKDVAIRVHLSPEEIGAMIKAHNSTPPHPATQLAEVVCMFLPPGVGPDSLLAAMGPAPETFMPGRAPEPMSASPGGPNPHYDPQARAVPADNPNTAGPAPRSGPDFEGIEALIQERRSRASAVEAASKIGVDKAAGLIFADGVDVFRNNTFSRFDVPQHLREQALALLGQIVAYHEAEIVRIDSSFAGVHIPGN